VGKGKLRKFQEIETFNHVIEPELKGQIEQNHAIKGNWNNQFFKNLNPIVLELGCGKGEYSVGLAKIFPNKNFIGIDIKGARIWRGAKTSLEEKIINVGFLRTRIELITRFFAPDEVSEIWITFPDPQMKRRRAKKRLTSSLFLSYYQNLIKNNAIIHLKTDSTFLYEYTNAVVKINGLEIIKNTSNLYAENWKDEILSIQTHYEKLHIDDGDAINYISFYLDKNKKLIEPFFKEDDE
jgi:tRNA (guanine-N7-)-methyltransferase